MAIKEQVVVITGASSGIGEAIARELGGQGAQVVLAARRINRLTQIAQDLQKAGAHVTTFPADVTQYEAVQALAKHAIDTYGRVDVWINNAGLMPLSYLNKRKVEEWDQMIDVNLKGVLYGIAAVLPFMEQQQSGHIINVSSVAGHRVGLGGAVYSATKFGVRALTEGLRMEVSPTTGIRTTIISPGLVETELLNTITDEDALSSLKARAASALNAGDIARAVRFAIEQPAHVSINEILVRPTSQPT